MIGQNKLTCDWLEPLIGALKRAAL